tara:strand:+ start:47 stop:367 length:321 start_codon:yes stop_codon:yes gene_type:complete
MEDKMKIEKGIPIPVGNGNGVVGKFNEIAKQMEIGDSVGGLTKSQRASLTTALNNLYCEKKLVKNEYYKRHDLRPLNKVFRSLKEKNNLYRVWRVEKPTQWASEES